MFEACAELLSVCMPGGGGRFEKLLSAWHTLDHGSSGQGPTHHADLLLGLTMLDYQMPDYLLQSIVKVREDRHGGMRVCVYGQHHY